MNLGLIILGNWATDFKGDFGNNTGKQKVKLSMNSSGDISKQNKFVAVNRLQKVQLRTRERKRQNSTVLYLYMQEEMETIEHI